MLVGRATKSRDGFVGNFAAADACELAIHKIGAHFPGKLFIAPVANMLEQQKAENDLGRGAGTTARLALFARLAPRGLH